MCFINKRAWSRISILTIACNVKIIQLFVSARIYVSIICNAKRTLFGVWSAFCFLWSQDPSGWAGGGATLPEELLPLLSLKAWNVEPPGAAQHVTVATASPLLSNGYHGTLNFRTFWMWIWCDHLVETRLWCLGCCIQTSLDHFQSWKVSPKLAMLSRKTNFKGTDTS